MPGIEVEVEVELVVEVLLVVVVGEQGVPAASAVKNGVKSTLAVTLSHPALPGPAAQPHQLFSAAGASRENLRRLRACRGPRLVSRLSTVSPTG